MQKKMKALVKKHSEHGIWLDEVDVPTIGVNDVLIKIKKTAICGTDIHIYEWNDWAKATIPVPMVVGHEYVGEVVEVGQNVTGVKVGELVSGEGHIVCGTCRNCRGGVPHLCKNTKGVGVNRTGAFAEYLAIPASNVWHCNPKIDEELYSIFDPLGNATHTALSFDLLGKDVLITGAGPIGIMAAMIAKHCRARSVVLTDVNPYRIDLAKKLGIEHTVNTKEKSLEQLQKELNVYDGFDVGMEMSGNQYAFREMIDAIKHGGKISLLGIQGNDTRVDWNKIVFKGLLLKGIYGREMYDTWYKMESLLETGLDLSPIITHRFAVEDYQKGFEIMASGNSGKIILNW